MKSVLFFGYFLLSVNVFAQHNHPMPSSSGTAKITAKEEPRVEVNVPPEQQERIGLRTGIVQKKPLTHIIRTIGTVTADQRKEAHVHSKLNGWIETIFADYVGKPVKKDSPLFDLYSPELVSTQEEYISASKQSGVGQELARAALDRLRLWGVPEKEIVKLKSTKKSSRTITFYSPVDGVVVTKNAIQGMYITPGLELYQIADLSRVWILVTLYEYDVAIIKEGDEAAVEVPYDPKLNLKAKISYISPDIDLETRTAKARLEVDNKSGSFKPGMYVNITLKKNLGESIVIPDDSLIDTGLRKIVFVKKGSSSFEPREVKVGPRVENQFAILSGLKEGEEIVTSAHFLIDTESKLRAAVEKGGSAPSHKHGGH